MSAAEVAGSVTLQSNVTLRNGVQMPLYGLGLSHNGGWNSEAVQESLKQGVRLYDTAKRYQTESLLGAEIASFLSSQTTTSATDLFLTSKLWPADIHQVKRECQMSCHNLKVESLDLYLVHWPGGWGENDGFASGKERREYVWRQMELLLEQGLCRSIGVSNYLEKHLVEAEDYASVLPHVNQIEHNPFQNPKSLKNLCLDMGIVVEGYSPLAKGMKMVEPRLLQIAKKYNASVAQIMIRWGLQHRVVTIPKTTRLQRVNENIACLDCLPGRPVPHNYLGDWPRLSPEDMQALDAMDENLRVTWNPQHVVD